MRPPFGKRPKRARDMSRMFRLAGTQGIRAIAGEAVESKDGQVCWELDPAYSAWFWPFMDKAATLVLLVPENRLEPIESGDRLEAPRAPTRAEKDKIVKLPEDDKNGVRVYSLVLRGKSPTVHKAFPTRIISERALRYCGRQASIVVPEEEVVG